MLNRRDLSLAYGTFWLLSKFRLLPLVFDKDSGRIQLRTRGLSGHLWKFWLINQLLYFLWVNSRLIQSVVSGPARVEHWSLHIIIASFSLIMVLWAILLFIKRPDLTKVVFNQLDIADLQNKRKRWSYSIQEWLILGLPSSVFGNCPLIFILMYYKNPTSLQFLYSVLPDSYQTQWSFHTLIFYETLIFVNYLATVYFGIYVQLGFIEMTRTDLENRARNVKSRGFSEATGTGNVYWLTSQFNEFRRTELRLKYFNLVFADIIFSYKLQLITGSTSAFYFSIRFHENPIYGVALFTLAVYLSLLFIIIYDKAFSVPGKMEQLKNEILLVASQAFNSTQKQRNCRPKTRQKNLTVPNVGNKVENFQWVEIKQKIRSVPNVGIKVGDFRTLERTSTPNFVDFIVKQVCSLLIALR